MKTPEEINIACAERLGWKLTQFEGAKAPFYFLPGHEPARGNPLASYGGPQIPPTGPVRPCEEGMSLMDTLLKWGIPNFHGSLDAAMQLVERAKESGFKWMSSNFAEGKYRASFVKGGQSVGANPPFTATHKLPAAAICIAFLQLPATKPQP